MILALINTGGQIDACYCSCCFLFIWGQMNYSQSSSFCFNQVRSKFNRNRQSRSVVEIFVEDSTVNFRIYNVSLPENAPIGTYVTNVAIESGFMTANYPSEVSILGLKK